MGAIDGFRNNCTLVAVREVCGRNDEEILAAFRRHGYRDNHGMYPEKYHAAAKELGVEFGPVKYAIQIIPIASVEGYRRRPRTIFRVLKALPRGTFFVSTRGHVLVVRDGVVVDPNWKGRAAMGREVVSVVEVLNAVKKTVQGFIKVARPNVRRRTPAARLRWWKLQKYLIEHPTATYEDVRKHTDYPKIDLDWDLRRGNLIIV